MDVVFSRVHQVDWEITHLDVTELNNVTELAQHDGGTFLLPVDELELSDEKYTVFMPSSELGKLSEQSTHVHVYFDLESYPFFQKAKEIIDQEAERKGVFRFRRMVNESTGLDLLAGDLFVLGNLFGEPEDISIKKTDTGKMPVHVIVLVNFGGGTMAHIEYTVTNHERIELEWSGMNHIIEFDSDEMSPFQPKGTTELPLMYGIDSLIETAHKVDEEFLTKMKEYEELIAEGEQS